jgi:chorismate dehydratase
MPLAASPLGRYRIGSVPYLNAVPLTHGLEAQVRFLAPSELAAELQAGRLDCGLVSVTEVLLHEGYDVLDGVGIVSHGPVASVFLAHREPLEQIRTVFVDAASGTSVNLLRVLMGELGLQPEFQLLESYAAAPQLDNVLLIGNPALEFRRGGHPHHLWDLGAGWAALTGLPFVYAVWALRGGVDLAPLAAGLRAAAAAGLKALPEIVEQRSEFDPAFRRAYLGGHIRYELGANEKAGLKRFAELLLKHTGRPVFPPHYL